LVASGHPPQERVDRRAVAFEEQVEGVHISLLETLHEFLVRDVTHARHSHVSTRMNSIARANVSAGEENLPVIGHR
jgi:hypothetical protein